MTEWMFNHIFLLHFGHPTDLRWLQNRLIFILGSPRKQVSNQLQPQRIANHISIHSFLVLELLEAWLVTDLRWFINCFNVYTDAFREIRVLWIVPIQVGHFLLHAAGLLPPDNKRVQVGEIHEGAIIYVTPDLAWEDYVGWETPVTHTEWVGFVFFAEVVYFVGLFDRKGTVGALCFGLVKFLAPKAHLSQERVKTLVLWLALFSWILPLFFHVRLWLLFLHFIFFKWVCFDGRVNHSWRWRFLFLFVSFFLFLRQIIQLHRYTSKFLRGHFHRNVLISNMDYVSVSKAGRL